MATTRLIWAISALLCLGTISALSIGGQYLESIRGYHEYPRGKLVFNPESLRKLDILYGVCDKSNKAEKTCEIHLDKMKLVATGGHESKKCQVALKGKEGTIGDEFKLLPLANDRAILAYVDRGWNRLQISIVELSNCNVVEAELQPHISASSGSLRKIIIVPYEDTFDVIHADWEKCLEHYCKTTIDASGKKINGPVPWYAINHGTEDLYALAPVARLSPSKGYLGIWPSGPHAVETTLFKPNGTIPLTACFGTTAVRDTLYSIHHDSVAVCCRTSHVDCSIYDENGERTLTVKQLFDYETPYTAVHPLDDGGFLLASTECKEPNCRGSGNRYHVTKVRADGKRVGSDELNKLDCDTSDNDVALHFFRNDADVHCLAAICYENGKNQGPGPNNKLSFTAKCFNNFKFQE